MSQTKSLITERDVQTAIRSGETVIRVDGRPIITPLAASTLKEHGIRVVAPGGHGGVAAPTLTDAAEIDITAYDRRLLLDLYTTMQRIRAFEVAVGILFRQEHIIGFAHLSIGQEAVPAGVCAALDKGDYLTLTHRGHGQMIARGARMDAMMAELYGKATGYCKGKGGSVHLADFQRGILGANGIVGAGIAIATGAAMSAKMQDTRQVALAFFGDGAVNQGAFHESLNTAVFMQLPAIYVCENNQYAVSMPASKATSSKTIADRGRSYGMSSVQVDGQNVLAVYDAAKRAVERARRGEGPSFIECLTYRFRGHWEGETVELRSASEMEQWQRQDPIQGLEQAMLDAGIVSEERLREIWDHICDEVAEAIRFAEQSPEPEPEEAVQDVLSGAIAAQPG